MTKEENTLKELSLLRLLFYRRLVALLVPLGLGSSFSAELISGSPFDEWGLSVPPLKHLSVCLHLGPGLWVSQPVSVCLPSDSPEVSR